MEAWESSKAPKHSRSQWLAPVHLDGRILQPASSEEEREMIPYCLDAGIGYPWSPLARESSVGRATAC